MQKNKSLERSFKVYAYRNKKINTEHFEKFVNDFG